MLEREIDENQIIVLTTDFHGEAYAPSKRIPLFRLPFAFSGEAFKHKGLSIIDNPLFAVMVIEKDELSDNAAKLLLS